MVPLPKLVAVEFPGVLRDVNDPKNALEALGGENAVRAYITTPPSPSVPPLTLNLRPSNKVSQSNIRSEDPRPTPNFFLIKICYPATNVVSSASTLTANASSSFTATTTRPTSTPQEESVANTTEPTLTKATTVKLVGRVTAMTEFRSLADYQYHPSPGAIDPYGTPDGAGVRRRRAGLESMASPPIAERVFHSLTHRPASKLTLEQCIDRLRPFRFARPIPEHGNFNYWYRQYAFPTPSSQQHQAATGPLVFVPGHPLGNDRRSLPDRLRILPHRVSYAIDSVPMDAPVIAAPVMRGRVAFLKLVSLLRLLFQERPVWVRRALLLGVPVELRTTFKKAIEVVAYSFQGSGPFFQACVKYGYDPRKDPSSRKYQVLELRCGHPLLEAVRNMRGEKSLKNKGARKHERQQPQNMIGSVKKKRRRRLTAAEEEMALEDQRAGISELSLDSFKMTGEFVLDDVPMKRNNFFQICDVKLEAINKVIEEQPVIETYDPKHGFFSTEGMAKVQFTAKKTLLCMAEDFLREEKVGKIMQGDYSTVSKMVSKKRGRLPLKEVMKEGVVARRRMTKSVRKRNTSAEAGPVDVVEDVSNRETEDQDVTVEGGPSAAAVETTELPGDYDGQLEMGGQLQMGGQFENVVPSLGYAGDGMLRSGEHADDAVGLVDGGQDEFEEDNNDDDVEEEEGEEEGEEYGGSGLTGFEVYGSDDGGGEYDDDDDDEENYL